MVTRETRNGSVASIMANFGAAEMSEEFGLTGPGCDEFFGTGPVTRAASSPFRQRCDPSAIQS